MVFGWLDFSTLLIYSLQYHKHQNGTGTNSFAITYGSNRKLTGLLLADIQNHMM